MKTVILLMCFSLLLCISAPACRAEKTEEGVGLAYGQDHAYFITAPAGWILDTESGAGQGVFAVFYPKGSDWNGPAVIYSNAASREGRDPVAAIAEDIKAMKEHSPGLKVLDGGTLPTEDGKKAFVRYLAGDQFGNLEAVAYVMERKVVVNIVLNARNKSAYENALPAFKKLVSTYRFITETPEKLNLAALQKAERKRKEVLPKTMLKIVMRTLEPKTPENANENQVIWRSGLDYYRMDILNVLSRVERTLAIGNEPDMWIVDEKKKIAQHLQDSGPEFGAKAPIFAQLAHGGVIGELEYGKELEFFIAHKAKKLEEKDSTTYTLDLDGVSLRLKLHPKTTIPWKLSCTRDGKTEAIEYLSFEQLKFQPELFTAPKGLRTVDVSGRASSN